MKLTGDLQKISEDMQDEDLDRALEMIQKAISKPDIPKNKVAETITELQGLAARFGLAASYYTTFGKGPAGSPANHKKNMYYTARDVCDKLVDALKYQQRWQETRIKFGQ